MKIAIVYPSVTGNTKTFAEKIKEKINEKDLVYFGKPSKDIKDADTYIVGSWTTKYSASPDILNYLKTLKNKNIIIFQTAGYGDGIGYYDMIFTNIKNSIDDSNKILGHYCCRCKVTNKVEENYINKFLNNSTNTQIKEIKEGFKKHNQNPTEEDINNIQNWIEEILNKKES